MKKLVLLLFGLVVVPVIILLVLVAIPLFILFLLFLRMFSFGRRRAVPRNSQSRRHRTSAASHDGEVYDVECEVVDDGPEK